MNGGYSGVAKSNGVSTGYSGEKSGEKDGANGKKSGFFSRLTSGKKGAKAQYDGDMKNGKANGQGSCTWPNGDTYEGEWRDNRMHGKGVFVWKQKSCRYEGEYKDGLSHGKGKLFLRGEGQYEGDFVAGKKHGRGKWMGPDDMVYNGEYFEDRRHGLGTLKLSDGSCYEGEWKEGKFDGEGVWTWRDGRRFCGLFQKDHPVGGDLNYEGATRQVMWDVKTGTFVSSDQSNEGGGQADDSISPRRWSGGAAGKSIAADASTPPAASGMWNLCTSSRKELLQPNSARTFNTNNTFDDDDMPPLPVKEGWSMPNTANKGTFDDHRRRLCAWTGLV